MNRDYLRDALPVGVAALACACLVAELIFGSQALSYEPAVVYATYEEPEIPTVVEPSALPEEEPAPEPIFDEPQPVELVEETLYESYYWPQQNDAPTEPEGVLTADGGVNWFEGRRETWYSQRVLPGGGLDIPGRHVAEDGTIRDGDGYICVAASDLEYGTVVETSLGTGKVYDTGCEPGTTDIYVDW